MVLTREFKETVRKRVREDFQFRRALLMESVELFLVGDSATRKAVLRDYINAIGKRKNSKREGHT